VLFKIKKIVKSNTPLIKSLLVDYLTELSIISKTNIDTNYTYLDTYFTDKNRSAYFFYLNDKIIGFGFINDYCIINTNKKAIAEFYIKKEYRKQGLGETFARKLFELHNTSWEVKTNINNKNANLFWKKIITKYSINSYYSQISDSNVIFSF